MTSIDVEKLKRVVENPSLIKKIRVENGLSQRALAKLVNCSQGTIWAIEEGCRKRVSVNVAKKLMQLFKSDNRLPSNERVNALSAQIAKRGRFTHENAKVFASKGGQKGALIAAVRRRPTSQERQIEELLVKKSITFTRQALVHGDTRHFVVDFALPSEESPKIIIEAKSLPSKFRKDSQMISLAWRIIKMKQKYPGLLALVWLEGEIPPSALQIVKDEADYVALNEPVEKLSEIVGTVTKHRSRV